MNSEFDKPLFLDNLIPLKPAMFLLAHPPALG
jgi:hypothetical protein